MVITPRRRHVPRQADQVHPVQGHGPRPRLKGQNVVAFHERHIHRDGLGRRKLECSPGRGVGDRDKSTAVDPQHLGGGRPRVGVADGGLIIPRRKGVDIKNDLAAGGGDIGHVIAVGGRRRLGNRHVGEVGVLGFEGLVPSQVRLGDLAPAIVVENDLPHLQIGVPAMVGVVIMVGEITAPAILESFPSARADVLGVGG